MFDLVIRNGTLVTASDTFRADLAIREGKIATISRGQRLRGLETIDARGKLVVPGGIDPHVHLHMPTALTISSDDWETGTIAAACGGTTTLLDFVDARPGQPLLEAFHARRGEAEGQAVVDFGLHMTIAHTGADVLAQLPQVIEAGLTSFKAYTTYAFGLDDAALLSALHAVQRVGGLLMVHAENHAIVEHLKRELVQAGRVEPRYHPRSRPAAAEGEAVERVLALAEITRTLLYVVHVSTARGAAALARAQARGQAAFGETCPQYLLLNEAEYERPAFEGAKYICSPPLRTPGDNAALWRALAQGELHTVGTDHCPFNFVGQKDLGHSFDQIPGGLPGVEARLALLYTFGVGQGRLSLNRWIDVCCTSPARLFGLYPRKGTLAPGADADIVIFDPDKPVSLSKTVLHENVDYTPYEGLELNGWPVLTLSRGVILVRDGRFSGPRGHGRYLKRSLPPL